MFRYDPAMSSLPPQAEDTFGQIDPEWFRQLLEHAPDGMVLSDQAGRIVLVNARAEAMFGYARAELLGESIDLLIPASRRQRHAARRADYAADPRPRSMGRGLELSGRRRDGTEFPVEVSLSPLRAGQGTYVMAAVRDATEQRRAQQKFRGLLENAPDAMVIIDERGVIRIVNAQAERLFGYPRAELIGESVEILVPERMRGRHERHRAGYFQAPRIREMGAGLELCAARKDGSEFSVEISIGPLETEEGHWATAAIRDITGRKGAERTLAALNEQLRRSNRELEQFAYVASHDLQAPLRAVVSFCQLLQKKGAAQMDEEARRYIDFIVGSATRMRQLIQGLLSLARVGRSEVAVEPVDFNQLLEEVRRQLLAVIQERSAQLSSDPLPVIRAVPVEMAQLLQNLVSNAIKFQPGEHPRVHVSAWRAGAHWQFSVSDYGIGIRPDDQRRIFKIFQRLQNAEVYDGTGIGLAICEKIVTRHGGRIWVESEPGKGSCFHFTIVDEPAEPSGAGAL